MKNAAAVLILGLIGAIALAQGTTQGNVAEMVKAYQDAFNAGNAEAVAQLFADNGWLAESTGAVYQGRDAILAYVKKDIASNPPGVTLKLTTDEVVGPAARGTWEALKPDGTSLAGGQWVVVTENVNGHPLVRWLISNVVLPPSMTGGS